jgi:hypothetical protein
MLGSRADVLAVLSRFNPWWSGAALPSVPDWRRAAFRPLSEWAAAPAGGRALLLSGARQVGKTTLLLQLARQLGPSRWHVYVHCSVCERIFSPGKNNSGPCTGLSGGNKP